MRTTNKEYPGVKFDVCVWDVYYLRLKEDEDDGSKEDVGDFISEYEQDFRDSMSLTWRENRKEWLD